MLKSGKCFPGNTGGIVFVRFTLSLGMVPACSPWTGVGYTACSIHIWWRLLSSQPVLTECFREWPLCTCLKCGVRPSLHLLHSLLKMTHWICVAMVQILSGFNVLRKSQRISFSEMVSLKYSSSCLYNQRRKNLFSSKGINESFLMVWVCPNASVSGSRGVKGCWSVLQVNFRH